MSRALASLALTLICAAVALVALIWMPLALIAGAKRGWRLAIAWDQIGNALAGGDEDEVFSSRCWRYRDRMPYQWLIPVIDWCAERLGDGPEHCRISYVNEVSKRNGWRTAA